MKTNEIVHINSRYRKQDCELLDRNKVMIRLKTGKDIKKVEIIYNDPYIRLNINESLYWPFNTIEMTKTGETDDDFYFTAVLNVKYCRLKYYFKVYDEYECIQYSESGFTKYYKHDDLAMFFIPYIDKGNIFLAPKWLDSVVWYQVFPHSFNKDLQGIKDKLLYLKDLGVNGLYLNPIYKAKSYHKYDVIDYTKIDDDFGDEDDFKELCNTAKKLDFKIMLDISFTHCSYLNPMFQDVLKNKKASKYFKWFKMYIDENDEINYECFGMIKDMPKFQTEYFEVRNYFAQEVVRKWMNYGVDAWRLDVANEISDEMLATIRREVKRKKESYIVGEIWHNASEWISNTALDGVTNYAVSRAILSFVCNPLHDIMKYRSDIDTIIHSYPLNALKASMPLLDSHDTPRLRTICNDDKDKIKLALLLLMTFYGSPSIYYGTERFMSGGGDPDNRRKVDWNSIPEDNYDIFNMLKKFIELRKKYPALSNDGTFTWLQHNELLIIKRSNDEEIFYIVINSKEYGIFTVLPFEETCLNLVDGNIISKNVYMSRLGFMILKKI